MLRDIVLVQKRELENRFEEMYVERKSTLPLELGNDLIHLITGPRRAGKSFYAVHLIQQTAAYGYVNFDDERLTVIKDYDEIIGAVNAVYDNPRYLLFDEIQNLPRWEFFVNRLQRQGLRLLITGSNANLLSSELATHLTGRHTSIVLFPFSFAEYLKTSGGEKTEIEKMAALDIYQQFPEAS
jgi:predicted AAA+ superfamily ATPase